MELSKVIPALVQLSIALVVISLGLKSTAQDVRGVLDRPALLVRSLLALNVVVPALVILAVTAFQPIQPVKIALVLLAISPVPPILPMGQSKLSSDSPYIYGLLIFTSILSIVFVPAAVAVLDAIVPGSVSVSVVTVGKVILLSVLVPLFIGAGVRRLAPAWAARLALPLLKVGLALLMIGLLLILIGSWRVVISLIGNGTILIIAVVAALALATGHLMGGPDHEDRVVLALAACSRHPGVALAIAGANYPGERTIQAAVLLYLLLNAVFSQPYKKWWKRMRPAATEQSTLSVVQRQRRSA